MHSWKVNRIAKLSNIIFSTPAAAPGILINRRACLLSPRYVCCRSSRTLYCRWPTITELERTWTLLNPTTCPHWAFNCAGMMMCKSLSAEQSWLRSCNDYDGHSTPPLPAMDSIKDTLRGLWSNTTSRHRKLYSPILVARLLCREHKAIMLPINVTSWRRNQPTYQPAHLPV